LRERQSNGHDLDWLEAEQEFSGSITENSRKPILKTANAFADRQMKPNRRMLQIVA
jgi:hypothetical protein